MSSILSPNQDNVKLYLPFSEGSGSTAYDYSGEGNNGTITGATYVKVQDGDYALECTTDTISWSDTGAIGTKLCWKDVGSGWVLDRAPTFITTTGMTSFTGDIRLIIITSDTKSTDWIDKFEQETFIQ